MSENEKPVNPDPPLEEVVEILDGMQHSVREILTPPPNQEVDELVSHVQTLKFPRPLRRPHKPKKDTI